MDKFEAENRKQIENQMSVTKQFAALKDVAETFQSDNDGVFEKNIKHLEQEHRQQLQHQAEMMCQVIV